MDMPLPPRQAAVDILVAEDSPTQSRRLMRILGRQGWRAAAAADGRQALEMALRMAAVRPPSLILSDVVMPGMDGYELTRRVKAEPALRNVPVVLVTGMSDPHEVMRGLECGADCFILKPYDEQHLVARIHSVLQNTGAQDPQADAGDGIDIVFDGRRHHITADRRQILNLLLSTYDAAIQRNQALSASQEALERARREAEAANRAKSTFLAAMSHEIRTPMNGVIGMVDVLHQTSLHGPQAEMVALIRESAFSLLGIIEDVLDFSKIEAGKLEVESEPMPLAGIVETACAMLDNLAARKGVELTVFVDPALPERVLGDALRLRQVLINLANNAIKFSGDSSRTGRVGVRVERDGAWMRLVVADNGIGMDEPTLSRLFTSFSQADVSIARRFGGTGLGLAISSHLTQLMGGDIQVTSTPGRGSTFVVRLPCVAGPPDAADAPPAFDLTGLRCMLVGSLAGLADDHEAYLRHAGAQVERVADVVQAGRRTREQAGGLWVWVVDARQLRQAGSEGRPAADLPGGHDVRLVMVDSARGTPSAPADTPSLVSVNVNALGRLRFLKAVAQVAGRLKEGAAPASGQPRWSLQAPPRATALAQGRLVLVTDDNEINQQVIQRQLGLLGVAADVVADGQTALARWRSGDYALLLTDLHMPVLDGHALTAAIRAEEASRGLRRMPIVALSANAAKEEAQRCREVGMDEYLSKPVLLNDLNAMLGRFLPPLPQADQAMGAQQAPRPPAVRSATAAPVDLRVLRELVGDNPAVVDDVLQKFRLSACECGARIRAAGHAGQTEALAAAAHRLKSAALAVGASGLGELCDHIESQCRRRRTEQLPDLLARFESEAQAVEQYLSAR